MVWENESANNKEINGLSSTVIATICQVTALNLCSRLEGWPRQIVASRCIAILPTSLELSLFNTLRPGVVLYTTWKTALISLVTDQSVTNPSISIHVCAQGETHKIASGLNERQRYNDVTPVSAVTAMSSWWLLMAWHLFWCQGICNHHDDIGRFWLVWSDSTFQVFLQGSLIHCHDRPLKCIPVGLISLYQSQRIVFHVCWACL